MKIKIYWPNCNYLNGEWANDGIDSYWVECAYEEAERIVFPYLSPDQIQESLKIWEPQESNMKDFGIETYLLCYLISKDLKSIVPMPWYYPFSGQWNDQCPFIRTKEIEIKDLSEILGLVIEKINC